MRGLGLSAALLALASAVSADPLSDVLAKREKEGFRPAQILRDGSLAAVLLQDGRGRQALSVYAVEPAKVSELYGKTFDGRLELDSSQGKAGFPDLFSDGERALLYNDWSKDGRRRTLHILRVHKGRVKELGAYPQGEVKQLGAGKGPELVTQSFPWEKFSPRQCPAFQDMGASARKTEILSWTGGRFASATSRFPSFFVESIIRDEQALQVLDKVRRPGDYLGGALSLYYDYAAKGEKRRGWDGLGAVLKSTAKELPGQAECLVKIRREVRSKLSIPDEWP